MLGHDRLSQAIPVSRTPGSYRVPDLAGVKARAAGIKKGSRRLGQRHGHGTDGYDYASTTFTELMKEIDAALPAKKVGRRPGSGMPSRTLALQDLPNAECLVGEEVGRHLGYACGLDDLA
jgi:hypothetical protein